MRDDEFYDMVYELMIENTYCEKYVSNPEFINHMRGNGWELRGTQPNNGERVLDVAEVVSWFFGAYELNGDLEKDLVAIFIPRFNQHEEFANRPIHSKKAIAFNTLYYCLGIITLDYIQYNNL